MADNAPSPEGVPPAPAPQSGGAKPPPLPPAATKKGNAGKVMVSLSSVAKPAPGTSQKITSQQLSSATGKEAKATSGLIKPVPPPLSAASGAPGAGTQSVGSEIKLPQPRKATGRWPSLSGSPVGMPGAEEPPKETSALKRSAPINPGGPTPPRPANMTTGPLLKAPAPAEPKKVSARLIPPIKLNSPKQSAPEARDSIFEKIPEPEAAPVGWKQLQPGELEPLPADALGGDVFSRSQPLMPAPSVPMPSIVVKGSETPAPTASPQPEEKKETLPPKQTEAAKPAGPSSSTPDQTISVKGPETPTPPQPEAKKESLPVANQPVDGKKSAADAPGVKAPETENTAESQKKSEPEKKSDLPVAPAPSDQEKAAATQLHVAPRMLGAHADSHATEKRKQPHLPTDDAAGVTKLRPPQLPAGDQSSGAKLPAPHLPSDKPREEETPRKLPPPLPRPEMKSIVVAKDEPERVPEPAAPAAERKAPPLNGPSPSKVTGPIVLRLTEQPLKINTPEAKAVPVPTPVAQPPLIPSVPTPVAVKSPAPKVEEKEKETKPALRPAVLPNKMLKAVDAPPKSTGELLKKASGKLISAAKAVEPVPVVKTPDSAPSGKINLKPLTETKPAEPKAKEATPALVAKQAEEPPQPAAKAAPETGKDAKKEEKKDTPKETGSATAARDSKPADSTKAPDTRPAPVELPKKKKPEKLPLTRAERAQRRKYVAIGTFYFILVLTGAALYYGGIFFSRETRLEGQVIPPQGTLLSNEAWLVNPFQSQVAGIADDDAQDRIRPGQDIKDHQERVQRALADLAGRDERIRMLKQRIDDAKKESDDVVLKARQETQRIWDVQGAQLDADYEARLDQVRKAIADRAKSLGLKYETDETYQSPEVWGNAYRLALYEAPKGVDSGKEYRWIADQLRQWRDFVKVSDQKREDLREKAVELKMSPQKTVTQLAATIDDLQHRIENAQTEEDPIKAELEQARADLGQVQAEEATIDPRYYDELSRLPGDSILKRISIAPNGRFSMLEDATFAEGEKEHRYWIFCRARRPDGREYWSLGRLVVTRDSTVCVFISPENFVSTKTLLRPDLPPEEQAQ